MPVERRGWVIAFEIGSTGNGRNPMFNGRRQPSRGGTSRMMREYQVRFCERLGVKFPGPTRQKLRFRAAQRPCVIVRSTPVSRPSKGGPAWLLSATRRHMQCSKKDHYSISVSTRSRNDPGIVSPSACAVLRLSTSSKWVGCSTGRSAGWAPFRILSTYTAASRKSSTYRAE